MGTCRLSLLLLVVVWVVATLVASAPTPQEASSTAPESRALGQPFDEVVVGTTLLVRPRSSTGRQGRRLVQSNSTEGSGVNIGEARSRRSPRFPPPGLASASASQAGAQSYRFPGGLSADVAYSAGFSSGPNGFSSTASFSFTAPDGTRHRFVYG